MSAPNPAGTPPIPPDPNLPAQAPAPAAGAPPAAKLQGRNVTPATREEKATRLRVIQDFELPVRERTLPKMTPVVPVAAEPAAATPAPPEAPAAEPQTPPAAAGTSPPPTGIASSSKSKRASGVFGRIFQTGKEEKPQEAGKAEKRGSHELSGGVSFSQKLERLLAAQKYQNVAQEQEKLKKDIKKAEKEGRSTEDYEQRMKSEGEDFKRAQEDVEAFTDLYKEKSFADAEKKAIKELKQDLRAMLKDPATAQSAFSTLASVGVASDSLMEMLSGLKKEEILALLVGMAPHQVNTPEGTYPFRGDNLFGRLFREFVLGEMGKDLVSLSKQAINSKLDPREATKLLLNGLNQKIEASPALKELFRGVQKALQGSRFSAKGTLMLTNLFCLRVLGKILNDPSIVGEANIGRAAKVSGELMKASHVEDAQRDQELAAHFNVFITKFLQ